MEKNSAGQILKGVNRCGIHPDYLKIRTCCNHVNDGTAQNFILTKIGDVLCQECFLDASYLTEKDIVFLCSECVKEIIDRAIKFITEEMKDDVSKYIMGYPENLHETKGLIDINSLIDEIDGKEFNRGIWEKK